MQPLSPNRVAVITRAAQGSGPAICEALGQQGFTIVLADTPAPALKAAAQRLLSLGIEALTVQADVSQVDQIESLLAQTVRQYGRLDLMVNNTPENNPQSAEGLPMATFIAEVSATVDSVFFGSQMAARSMLKQDPRPIAFYPVRGTIINIASVAGVVALPGHASFCSAMAGVLALTKVLAGEWGPQGIRVAAVGVGLTETLLAQAGATGQPDHDKSAPPSETYMTLRANAPAGYIPVGVPAVPAAVGRAVAYLADEAAAYITGTTLYVDGAWLAYGYL